MRKSDPERVEATRRKRRLMGRGRGSDMGNKNREINGEWTIRTATKKHAKSKRMTVVKK